MRWYASEGEYRAARVSSTVSNASLLSRLVAIARGEQEYFDPSGIPTATEACKSNALMRCCKDLGVASELWDPRFIREFKSQHCVEVFAEHLATKKKCVVVAIAFGPLPLTHINSLKAKALEAQGPAEIRIPL